MDGGFSFCWKEINHGFSGPEMDEKDRTGIVV
jgi:hypothetical protein